MKKNDGYKKIKSLFYIVAIILMVIAIIGKVKAEDYELQPFDSYFYDYIDSTYHINGSETIFNDFDNVPTDSWQYVEVSNSSNVLGFIYNDNRLDVSNFSVTSNAYNTNELQYVTWDGRQSMCSRYDLNYSNIICYLINYKTSSSGTRIYKINFGTKSYLNGSSNPYTKCSVTRTLLYTYNWQSYNSESIYGTFNLTNTLKFYNYRPTFGYCDTPYGWWTAIGTGTKGTHIEFVRITYDDNFIIYKSYGVGGIGDPLLNIQYADNIFSPGYTYTSSTTYSLTFDVDGMETTVSISSSAYPDDFLENGSFRTSFDLIYRMLSNKIVNFSSADNITLTQVSMSATAYPTSNQQGTPETVTKSTLCNLVLKGSEGSTDIESDVIPDITDVTIVFDQVVGSNDFHNHTGVYTPNQPVPSWADTYTIVLDTGGTTNHGAPWSTVDLYLPFEALSEVAFQGYTDPAFQIQGATYIDYNNLNAFLLNPEYLFVTLGLYNSCDVIRFVSGYWSSDGWLSDFDYVFYMQSYYTKLSIKGLGNIQSAVESGTYYTKSLYWYLKQRLDNMSDNIAEYEEKALSNQVVGNCYLQSINTNIISIRDSIDSGVNSIVSAISGISSGGSSYSLPSLSTELQRLFIPSLTWESIDFDEYMDSLGVLKIPFEMTNDVLDVTKASYSPTLDLHINDFEIDVTGNNDKLTVFEDQDYSFNPRSIFNNQAWIMLTYLNAFAVILAEAWFTYCHIFRREKADDR